MKKRKFWKYGQIKTLATLSGLSQKYLSDIINRRRKVSYGRALILEKHSKELGLNSLTVMVWLNSMTINHPAFKELGDD